MHQISLSILLLLAIIHRSSSLPNCPDKFLPPNLVYRRGLNESTVSIVVIGDSFPCVSGNRTRQSIKVRNCMTATINREAVFPSHPPPCSPTLFGNESCFVNVTYSAENTVQVPSNPGNILYWSDGTHASLIKWQCDKINQSYFIEEAIVTAIRKTCASEESEAQIYPKLVPGYDYTYYYVLIPIIISVIFGAVVLQGISTTKKSQVTKIEAIRKETEEK